MGGINDGIAIGKVYFFIETFYLLYSMPKEFHLLIIAFASGHSAWLLGTNVGAIKICTPEQGLILHLIQAMRKDSRGSAGSKSLIVINRLDFDIQILSC